MAISSATNDQLFTDAQSIMLAMIKLGQQCASYKERVYALGVVTNDPAVEGYEPAQGLDLADIDKAISNVVEFGTFWTTGLQSNAYVVVRNKAAQ